VMEMLLLGRPFILRTDHRNLLYMGHSSNLRVQRWYAYLSRYDITIHHIPGETNIVADALSRMFYDNHVPLPAGRYAMGQLQPIVEAPTPQIEEGGYTTNTDDDDDDMPPLVKVHKPVRQSVPEDETLQDQLELAAPRAQEEVQELFLRFHSGATGHLSLHATLQAVEDLLQCKPAGLRQAISRLALTCTTCAKARTDRRKRTFERHSLSGSKAFNTLQADFLTGLPISEDGFSKLLVLVDTFTRYAILIPIKDETAEAACAAFLQVYGTYGTPPRVISDGGPAFISEGWDQFCRVLGITHNVTRPNLPSSHGIVERMHREIIDKARKVFMDIAEANALNWNQYIPIVQRILNSNEHAATGYAPSELLFGTAFVRDMKLLVPALEPIQDTAVAHVRNLDTVLQTCRANALLAQEDQTLKDLAAQPTTTDVFRQGDYVLYQNIMMSTRKLAKFAPVFCGPVRVLRNCFDDFYELQDLVQDKRFFAHARHLQPYQAEMTDEIAQNIAKHDYDEWTVHSVVSHDVDDGALASPTTTKFTVLFEGSDIPVTGQRFKDLRFVPVVQDYIRAKKDLSPLIKLLPKEPSGKGMRLKGRNKSLAAFVT
jgi:transposase InsO family protein